LIVGGKLISLFLRLAIAALCLLPLRRAAQFGRLCGGVIYHIDARHRRMARQNLEECFRGTKSSAEVAEIARENFRRIGENICAAIKLASMDIAESDQLVEMRESKSQAVAEALRARNVLLASGHFGSFELFTRLTAHFPQYRQATTYRGLRPAALDDLLRSFRGRFGMKLYERRAGAEELRKELAQGGVMLTLFADQSDWQHGVELPFLGRPAFTNRAPAIMAARYDCSLFAPICYRVDLGRYRIEMGEPIPTRNANGKRRSCEEILRDINRAHEAAILRDPANWFWVHNRWKTKRAEKAPKINGNGC
jgi:lauroyl/myristoyl acyltransferase